MTGLRLTIAVTLLLSCTAPAPVAAPSPTATPPSTLPPSATASPSPSPAFPDLTVAAAGELHGDHALVLQLLTSAIAGVPSQPRFWDVPLDGGAPRQLVGYTRGPQGYTDFDSFDFSRQLSSDGRQLVLADPMDVAGSGLVIIDLIAGTARKIALPTGSDQPAWSPDGQRIAYRGFSIAGPYQQDLGIWVVSSAGGEPKNVVPSDIRAGSGAMYLYGWTADGSDVFFDPDPNTLSVVDLQSGQVTRIGDRTSGIAARAKPPSVAIVFYEDTPHGPLVGRVEVRSTALASPTVVARYGPNDGSFFIGPRWNPNNNELLLSWACGEGVAPRSEFVIVDGVTGGRRTQPAPGCIRSAVWSGDGTKILYTDLQAVRVQNADGSNDHELFRPALPAGVTQQYVGAVIAFAPH
jgi:hypothetical protein